MEVLLKGGQWKRSRVTIWTQILQDKPIAEIPTRPSRPSYMKTRLGPLLKVNFYHLRVDFQCRVIFTCVLCVKFTFANKIEAMHERSLVNVKVERLLTYRLSSALFLLSLFYLRD